MVGNIKIKLSKLIIFLPLMLSSCTNLPYQGASEKMGKLMCEDVIAYLDNGDKEGLYKCFSKNVRNEVTELPKQVEHLFSYYQRGFNSFILNDANYSQGLGSYRQFKRIRDIRTQYTFETTCESYTLSMLWRTNDDFDSKNIGLYSLHIETFISEESRNKFPDTIPGITINERN